MSLAALWKLPIVFICENNEYSMGTPLSRSMSVEDVSLKALGYGMDRDRFVVDHVLEVRDRIGEAVARARHESEPTLVEVRTYRFRGHSMSDPGKYRTPEELEEHKQRDALTALAQRAHRVRATAADARRGSRPRSRRSSPTPSSSPRRAPSRAPSSSKQTTYQGAFAR